MLLTNPGWCRLCGSCTTLGAALHTKRSNPLPKHSPDNTCAHPHTGGPAQAAQRNACSGHAALLHQLSPTSISASTALSPSWTNAMLSAVSALLQDTALARATAPDSSRPLMPARFSWRRVRLVRNPAAKAAAARRRSLHLNQGQRQVAPSAVVVRLDRIALLSLRLQQQAVYHAHQRKLPWRLLECTTRRADERQEIPQTT